MNTQRSGAAAAGRLHPILTRPQRAEGKAGAAAGLVNARHATERREDGVKVVCNREHEAGGELAARQAGVHQRRGVRQEFQPFQPFQKALLPERAVLPEITGGSGNGRGDTAQHAVGSSATWPLSSRRR